jgi:hypothetical protein
MDSVMTGRPIVSFRTASVLWAIFAMPGIAAWAGEMDVYSLPTTPEIFERIDPSAVRTDALMPYTAWQTGVETINPPLAAEIHGTRIAVIAVKVTDADFPERTLGPFVREAQERAARYGANMVCLEPPMIEKDGVDYVSVTFNAYRVDYQGHLIPPQYLAALPNIPVTASLLEENIQTWEDKRYGRERVSFMRGAGEDGREVVRYFEGMKNGFPVRVVFRDGSDYRGSFSGVDAEDAIWIRPAGWSRFFSDRSFRAQDIVAVSLLN